MSSNEKNKAVELIRTNKSINLNFQNLCYKPPSRKGIKQKPILKNICGTFSSGRFSAIVGPSGAGKSSLLNVLSGFKVTGVTGLITTNGEIRNKRTFRNESSYIPQEINLLPKLTVYETLSIAAELKFSDNVTKATKLQNINYVIEILKLQKCKHTYADKLSGGERKRLSIGTELLTNPPIMFLDEPTSGLDSSSTLQIITHLKTLANAGRTIICVIHQPSSKLLEIIDDLYVVADGRCIYNGPIQDLVETFREFQFQCPTFYNRADFALEVASGERNGNIEGLIDKFAYHTPAIDLTTIDHEEKTPMLQNVVCSIESGKNEIRLCSRRRYPISQFQQFLILLCRNFRCMKRDFFFVQMRILCHMLIGGLIGLVFYDIGNDAAKVQSNISCLFFFMIFIFFANTMPTILSFPVETSVFLHEHLNNYYSLFSYYMAKLVADLPLQIIGPTSFLMCAYFLTGQPYEMNRLGMLWVITTLTTCVSQGVGLIGGAAFSLQLGVFLVPCSAIPLLIFSGFFIKYNELFTFLRPLTYVSYFRYSFEGSIQAIYGFNRTTLDCSETFCYHRRSEKILKYMSMEENNFNLDVVALVVWIILLQFFLYVTLRIRLAKAQ